MAERRGKYRWVIVALLFAAMVINYVDRQMIGVLKPGYLQPEFGWSERDYADIVSWCQGPDKDKCSVVRSVLIGIALQPIALCIPISGRSPISAGSRREEPNELPHRRLIYLHGMSPGDSQPGSEIMRDTLTPAARHSALRYVIASEIPAEHKAVLIDVLTLALRNEEGEHRRDLAAEQAGGEWQEQEIEQLKSFLTGKVAISWQHADEVAMHLAVQLHRDPKAVRTKAYELGLGASVDYRSARAFVQARDR